MRNERFSGDTVQLRRFAYLHKQDRSRFGLLEAVDYRDARNHLGSRYHIRQVWLTIEDDHEQAFNGSLRWQIVSNLFLNRASVAASRCHTWSE